jgi:serine/threonine protein kinase
MSEAIHFQHDEIQPGMRLGHYVIMERIAQGGMGTVFKAVEPALERYVAIKILRPEYASLPEHVQYFQEEARAVAALQHPNIVPIHFIGAEANIVYFSMAFIDGETFDDWIIKARRFTAQDAYWFMTQAVAALEAASQANITHLDIKPSNFLIDQHNAVMLTDFGLAKRAGTEGVEREAFGTAAYVSPEQIMRDPTDLRTDIYSLGATLFHLLAGDPPFDGANIDEIVWGHLEKPFPADMLVTKSVPLGWINLIKKMMERSPADRFQTYAELTDALHRVDSFRYETHAIEIPPPVKPLSIPRSNYSPETLHGLIRPTIGDWAQGGYDLNLEFKREDILTELKSPRTPPKFPRLAKTMTELCRPLEGDVDDLLNAFEKFPGFYDQMYALASFLDQGEREIEAPEDILEIIGLTRMRSLALTSYMLNHEVAPAREFDWKPLWQHQIAVGLAVEIMYEVLSIKTSGFEFAAGLFHDYGKIILGELKPYAYFCVLQKSLHEEIPLVKCEQEIFGIDHAQIAEEWMRSAQVPAGLVAVAGIHESPEQIKRKSLLSHAVYSANHLIKQVGCGYSGNSLMDPRRWDELPSTQLVWEMSNGEYPWEDFVTAFFQQFQQFPEITLVG